MQPVGIEHCRGELHMIFDLLLFVGLATTFFVLGVITARR